MAMNTDAHRKIDDQIVDAAKNIKILSRLSWPAEKMTHFLDGWHKGNPTLPEVDYATADDLMEPIKQLSRAEKTLRSLDDPIATYLRNTAQSYLTLCELLQSVGTSKITDLSRSLYGSPTNKLADGRVTNLDAARHFLDQSAQYHKASHLHDHEYCVSAEVVKQDIEARLTDVFAKDTVKVVIDPHMASKAAAGAERIRLRGGTCFSGYDVEQLLQHEAFVHSLTALNGRAQPNIKSLGLGAPRTTGPQEGLATFSEMISGAIDIDRMARIAHRVVAIDMALDGADFIQVFRYFLDAGQPDTESFSSAMRIFRGAPVTGGSAFTKDVVYVQGLMQVHTFFRWAMSNQRLELCKYFFAGRMTITDAINLSPMFEDGSLAEPKYLPPWMTKTNGLAGYLAFSVFANKISIDALDEQHSFERVEDLSA